MQNPAYDRLRALPGVGPIVASAYLAAAGNGQQFQRGRQVSAWLGLVPRQYDTGGKMRLHGISKGGDRYLRTMLIHGARVVASWAQRRPQDNRRMARWTREAYDSASSDVENRLEPKKLPLRKSSFGLVRADNLVIWCISVASRHKDKSGVCSAYSFS